MHFLSFSISLDLNSSGHNCCYRYVWFTSCCCYVFACCVSIKLVTMSELIILKIEPKNMNSEFFFFFKLPAFLRYVRSARKLSELSSEILRHLQPQAQHTSVDYLAFMMSFFPSHQHIIHQPLNFISCIS